YLYIPLGGNRGGTLSTYRNLLLTMLLGGLWHGAAWTFVAWGAYHGALLALHRAIPWPQWTGRRMLHPARVAVTFVLVCIGWVLFRAESLGAACTILGRMATPSTGISLSPHVALLTAAILGVVLAAHVIGTFADVPRFVRALPVPVLGTALAGAVLMARLLA